MKRELLAVALAAIAMGSIARAEGTNTMPGFSQSSAPAPSPKIQFDKTIYDFGTTSLVDSLTGTFTFHNAGRGDLKIGNLPAFARVTPHLLTPGKKGELVFKLAIGVTQGTIAQFLTVPSNDPQTPDVSLSIKVKIEEILRLSPQYIQLGDIRQGTITNMAVLVHRTDGKKLVITKAEPSSKLLRVRIVPVTSTDNHSVIVIVEVDGRGTPRQFGENVKLFLEDFAQPASMISVNGRLLGDIAMEPATLYWRIADTSSTNSQALPVREIKISTGTSGQPLEIKNLKTDVKDLSLTLVTKDAGKVYVVVARLTKMPKQSMRGAINFETNTPSQPKVAIPVSISILKQSP
jgi:HYDIN/CFA65/VesB family protein